VFTKTGTKAQSVLESLAWDSAHFGFPVAQVTEPGLDDICLEEALRHARWEAIRLVYWPAKHDREAPAHLLRAFNGLLADRKATYIATNPRPDDDEPGSEASPFRVSHYPRGPASPRLVELALAAGAFSRFRVDPRIPAARFAQMYQTWIERSTQGELADIVLVASLADTGGEPVGMVTASATDGTGRIGLIAVDDQARGAGVGSLLIREAHRWMQGRGATQAAVVTQLENQPACRLYERLGYHLADVKNYYHFWPLEPAEAVPEPKPHSAHA
jgi:dTDP-4-amino-4,6-dideoxy-D-galactose acyltransferase